MSKPKTMPQVTWDYMSDLARHGMKTVVASELLPAAWLVEAGYAYVEDNREGPLIGLTTAGNKLAER